MIQKLSLVRVNNSLLYTVPAIPRRGSVMQMSGEFEKNISILKLSGYKVTCGFYTVVLFSNGKIHSVFRNPNGRFIRKTERTY
jgi:hypothetical protein